jgi:hypothetical protein
MGLPMEFRGKYVQPPTITETTVLAYAHCPDPRCQGVKQEQVQAVRTLTEWTFASRGGGDDPGGVGNLFLPMVENSQEHWRFVDAGELPCPHCEKPRELSSAPRPSYPIQVGGANALLRLQDMGIQFDPGRQEQIAQGAPETPLELLQRRFINDEITEDEFASKRGALSGVAVADPADDRIAVLEEQIATLLGTDDPPKRGPGRPRKEPDA